MFCPNCGKEIPDGFKFCPSCGAPIKKDVIESISETKHYKKLILVLTIAFLVIASLFIFVYPKLAHLNKKPIWPMFCYNAEHTGQCPYDTSKNNGALKWRYGTGDNVVSSSAIARDGTVYVGSWDDYLYALNPNGTLKWKHITGASFPAIASDGTVYVGSDDDYLYALNPDGTLKWRYKTGDGVSSSPAIASDGTVYVGSWDDYLYALNPDGTLKWRYKTGDEVYSSPAIARDGTIYIGSRDDYLYAIGSK